MQILLDECLDERLRHLFRDHNCQTARFAKLTALKNGALLKAAELAGFEVIITVDQNIPYQQNLDNRRIALLILCAQTNSRRDLQRLIPLALTALNTIQPGQVVRIT